jgi:anti-sigma28 factor (negative regulator of flagellin synthesis)
LSNNAIEFSRIRNLVNGVSEIREDRVGAILNEVRGGDYKVSSEQIASKLLREHIMDALLGDHVGQ